MTVYKHYLDKLMASIVVAFLRLSNAKFSKNAFIGLSNEECSELGRQN